MRIDKDVLFINGVYLDYDYKIKTSKGIYYIKNNLCCNGVCTKDKMGVELHKLALQNNVNENDIFNCINRYKKYFCYKIIHYTYDNNIIKIIYIMKYDFYDKIKDNFIDLD